jgi:hypothetical protein
MTVSGQGSSVRDIEAVEMHFPFDPLVTPTTILPQTWREDGSGSLPAVLSSPDFGQILLDDQSHPGVKARLEGNREKHTVDLILELPGVGAGDVYKLTCTPVRLAPPEGMTEEGLWQEVRRGWFNTWQPSSQWGDQGRPFSAPEGILANNVISDPVSFALQFYADQALWTPEIVPGISVMDQVRRSINWWLDHRMEPGNSYSFVGLCGSDRGSCLAKGTNRSIGAAFCLSGAAGCGQRRNGRGHAKWQR